MKFYSNYQQTQMGRLAVKSIRSGELPFSASLYDSLKSFTAKTDVWMISSCIQHFCTTEPSENYFRVAGSSHWIPVNANDQQDDIQLKLSDCNDYLVGHRRVFSSWCLPLVIRESDSESSSKHLMIPDESLKPEERQNDWVENVWIHSFEFNPLIPLYKGAL